jgi:hypothetical protein
MSLPVNKALSVTLVVKKESRTWYSAGVNFPSRAFLARSFISAEIFARPFDPASLMMGVMRPLSVATAIEISALWYLRSRLSKAVY